MKLSILIASRDDSWEQNPDGSNRPLDRLRHTLEWTLRRLCQSDEIVLVDWGSEKPLAESIGTGRGLRFIRVPPEVANRFGPFSEPHALNHAARHASGEWLARIDQDTLAGDRFFDWIRGDGPMDGDVYFSGRRDMAPGQRIPVGNEPPTYPIDGPDFWRWHVGVLMVERKRWNAIRGYDERDTGRNHMEHSLVYRLCRSGCDLMNLGDHLGAPFFHQWHIRAGHESRPQNRLLSVAELAALPEVANDEHIGVCHGNSDEN